MPRSLAAEAKAPVDDGWRIPDELWAEIAPLLPPRKPHPLGCHNPRVDDRRAMDAIFFVLRTACQWNALSATGICSSSSAHRRFQEWVQAGVFRELRRRGLLAYDELGGIDWEWQAIDGAMTKAPLGGEKAGRNPTDRGESGAKRSVLTDGSGVPLGVAAAGADEHDEWLVGETLRSQPVAGPEPTPAAPQHLCGDKGYDYVDVREVVELWGYTARIRARGGGAKEKAEVPGYRARRRVVERAHSWMNRFRRLLIRWEKKAANYLGLLHLACAWITYRAAGLLG